MLAYGPRKTNRHFETNEAPQGEGEDMQASGCTRPQNSTGVWCGGCGTEFLTDKGCKCPPPTRLEAIQYAVEGFFWEVWDRIVGAWRVLRHGVQ